MTRSRWGRLGLLGALYLAQGLPYGFFTQALPVLLRRRGLSLADIGLTSLLALPWALKFLWAPLVDRFFWPRLGRRRSWILPLQAASGLWLLAIAARGVPDDGAVTWLMLAVAVTNLLAATQDIATDGLAVDLLPPRERGLANGVQVAGYRLGMVAAGGGLLMLLPSLGWGAGFSLMALCVAATTVPVLLLDERSLPRRATDEDPAPAGPAPIHFALRRSSWPILALLVLYKGFDVLASAMLRPFLVDQGYGLADVGWMLGTVGFVAGLVGALLGGALVGPLGRRNSLMIFGIFQASACGAYAPVAVWSASAAVITAVSAADHLAGGMATAALFTCMMDWCHPRSAATDYTVQASTVVIATGLTSTFSGYLADAVGYPVHFATAGALTLVGTAMAGALFPTNH